MARKSPQRKAAEYGAAAAGMATGSYSFFDSGRKIHNMKQLAGRSLPSDGLARLTAKQHRAFLKTPKNMRMSLKKTFMTYTSNHGYKNVNEALRGKKINNPNPAYVWSETRKIQQQLLSSKVPAQAQLYRGTSLSHYDSLKNGVKTGATFVDHGIMSTSRDLRTAADFSRKAGKNAAVLVLQGKNMSGMSIEKISAFKQEREIALAGGQKFKVDHVAKGIKTGLLSRPQNYIFSSPVSEKAAKGVAPSVKAISRVRAGGRIGLLLAAGSFLYAGYNYFMNSKSQKKTAPRAKAKPVARRVAAKGKAGAKKVSYRTLKGEVIQVSARKAAALRRSRKR